MTKDTETKHPTAPQSIPISSLPCPFPEIELPLEFTSQDVQREMFAQMSKLNSVFHTLISQIDPNEDIASSPEKFLIALRSQEQYLKTVHVLQNLHMVATAPLPRDYFNAPLDE